MALRVVGAGLGRTGTHSLKLALEQLLGAPCYHMTELFERPSDIAQWQHAVDGQRADWDAVFDGFAAAVDWPTAAFYDVLMEVYPDAVVLLSTRPSAEAWWGSVSSTIVPAISRVVGDPAPLEAMLFSLLERTFTPRWQDGDAAMAAYTRHNEEVRRRVPEARLVQWQPGDGWGPLCRALGLPEPEEPFPHVNTTADFRAMTGLDPVG
ncbi:MAG TPA: sulfotransferase [Acidimicrobiales bacterium]|nr:sulfotransferase [Acidimicrobiales bacterium]